MDKKAIKNFAIDARKKLISEIKYKANLLGITADNIAKPIKESDGMEIYDIGGSTPYTIYDKDIEPRKDLVRQVKEKGFDNVVEEVAYTWFNRIIAIRFMEINDYLPTRVRVLSSETDGKIEPDIVTEAQNIDLNYSKEEIKIIYQLKSENKLDELFRFLFIKQCNKLNEILPELFEKTADYTELLLSISFTNEDGVVRQLIDSISEEDFTEQVEIIGWLYQYYNTELKDDTFSQLKKRVKISKERIPAATQLFTPDWIVRYMVENSLGRLWLEGHPDSEIKENWKYYLDETEQEPEVQIELSKIREDSKNFKPEDIKIIDPAMGSGHILVYAFDVLMQIYTSVGYSERDAAKSILKNNLYGLDIDDRAYQLAYFAVMMRARSYNPGILTKTINPQLCSLQETKIISDELINFVANASENMKNDLKYLVEIFTDAKEYGSIINVGSIDFISLLDRLTKIENTQYHDIKSINYQKEAINTIYPILKQFFILKTKYDVVITNPPYMGNRGMNKKISSYLKSNYSDSKKDIFAVFIEKGFELAKNNGFVSMITMQSWMFLSSFEDLRRKILLKNIINLVQIGFNSFPELNSKFALATSFVFRNTNLKNFIGTYLDLNNKYPHSSDKKKAFFSEIENNEMYFRKSNIFSKVPGSPIAYWASDNLIDGYLNGKELSMVANVKQGLATGDNKRFVRLWHEVDITQCGFGFKDAVAAKENQKKWFPYNKGGDFRKWYGNQEYLVNWEKNGYEIRNNYDLRGKLRSRPQNTQYYFKKGITYTLISTRFGVRYLPEGFIFDVAGSTIFVDETIVYYLLGLLSSKITGEYLDILNPTLNFQVGDIKNIPVIFSDKNQSKIETLVKENLVVSKNDWDSFETSWDFNRHPLLMFKECLTQLSFDKWDEIAQKRFLNVKYNEEKLNEIFIDVYNLKPKLNSTVEDSEITISKANLSRDIKSFISYAVGCMLGRYSLDEEGLIFAGGTWDSSKYTKFLPDDDNIIPILDTEYFEDDIVGRFVEFVKVTFGEDNLEENLDFIASALKKKGTTSREVIRNYFLTDFYMDHLQTYKKHPIYWLFDSGKNNGFKALIYMHRYEADLVARVRTDYLHKTQKALETAIAHNERIINNSPSASEKSKAVKAKDKLIKQLEETRKYDMGLAHLANQKIKIDLDDGVKVNYAKFQGVEVSSEGKKAAKVNLLKKI